MCAIIAMAMACTSEQHTRGDGVATSSEEESTALDYAHAVQEGDCKRVVELTKWMQDRLAYVRTTAGDAGEVAAAEDAMCADLQDRPVEGNQLGPEGIEDKYLFPPGASVTVARRDRGRDDLDLAVAHRTWLQVEYPVERYAPRDRDGRRIRSLRVGVNVSPEGVVVKAGVLGNVEIDSTSIVYDAGQGWGG